MRSSVVIQTKNDRLYEEPSANSAIIRCQPRSSPAGSRSANRATLIRSTARVLSHDLALFLSRRPPSSERVLERRASTQEIASMWLWDWERHLRLPESADRQPFRLGQSAPNPIQNHSEPEG